MREIKFRIWNKTLYQMSVTKPYFIGKTLGSLWFNTQPEVQDGEYVLMQFTGLKDKNGVEIYEGDILSEVGLVSWEPLRAGFRVKSFGSGLCNIPVKSILDIRQPNELEVLGNIYENPELLGDKNAE